jgi:hypothetical protein
MGNMDYTLFATYQRNIKDFKPSLLCSNSRDSFTVDSDNGNGKLKYPVGLLTADEYTYAGSGHKGFSSSAYLASGQKQWTLSPARLGLNESFGYSVMDGMATVTTNVNNGVRPSIALKRNIGYISGTGTVSDPYIVE